MSVEPAAAIPLALAKRLASGQQADDKKWPMPKAISSDLSPVKAFEPEYLPDSISPWAADIADRLQCPLDFVAVPALITLGAVIGRHIGIRPQRHTDWIEVPNLWGCIVGRPSMMKSPAINGVLKPLYEREAEARRQNEAALERHEREMEAFRLRKSAAEARAKKKKGEIGVEDLAGAPPEKPPSRRYITNDSSYESLGEILVENPSGVLVLRDELVSLLKTLDKEENIAARGFYLTGWNGTHPYTFDRIGRGHKHVSAVCLSLLGGTQPGRLSEYVRRANEGGAGDDGLLQRFGLLVWPDQTDWREVDRFPDSAARQLADQTFARLDGLTPDDVLAERDEHENVAFLRFDGEAVEIFAEWRADLEHRIRSGDMHPALESHLTKYRKLAPALALISHLADGGSGPIGRRAILRALGLTAYAESHARRCYSSGHQPERQAANAILRHIRKGDLCDGFVSWQVWRPGWSGLGESDTAKKGLALLVDLDWLAIEEVPTEGRTKTVYRINPRAMK